MRVDAVASSIKPLMKYANRDDVIEIAVRDGKKRFKAFYKVLLKDLQETNQTEKLNEVYEFVKNNTELTQKSLNNLSKLGGLNMLLSGVDLFVSAAGFAIMYRELKAISEKIDEVLYTFKEGETIQAKSEFIEVLHEHKNMLDCRKKQRYYSEEQMRVLVAMEYRVLARLIDRFLSNITNNAREILFSIIALAEMLSVSIRYFDEEYYFENKDNIKEGFSKWHDSHDDWIRIFDDLTDSMFVKSVQDIGIFEFGLSTRETDDMYIKYIDGIKALKQSIEDNQIMIESVNDKDIFEMKKAERIEIVENVILEDMKSMGISADNYKDALAIAVA